MEDSRPTLSRRPEPSVFTFPDTGDAIHTVQIDGDPWFVATPIARFLSYRDAANLLRVLDDDEKGTHTVSTPGGDQRVSIISLPGLLRSLAVRRAGAVKDADTQANLISFQRWVFHEVLPNAVAANGRKSTALALPQSYAEALRELASTVEQRDHAVAELETARPKVDAFDTYLSADDTDMLLRTAAKLLGTGERALRKHLLDAGFIFWTRNHTVCGRAQYEPYAGHQSNGLFSLKKVTVTHETFGDCNHQTVYVTPKGLEAVRRSIAKHVTALVAIEGGAR